MLIKLIKLNNNYKNHRLILILIIIFIIYIIFVFRIIKVSLDLDSNQNNIFKSISSRRDILDRNGKLLATSVVVASVFAKPNKIQNKEYAIQEIKKILSLDEDFLRQEIYSEKNFVWLKRQLNPEVAKQVFDLGIEGIDVEYEYKRLYPYGNLTSHLIGYTNIDNEGLAGIERQFNVFLTNQDISLQDTLNSFEQTTSENIFDSLILSQNAPSNTQKIENSNSKSKITNLNIYEDVAILDDDEENENFQLKKNSNNNSNENIGKSINNNNSIQTKDVSQMQKIESLSEDKIYTLDEIEKISTNTSKKVSNNSIADISWQNNIFKFLYVINEFIKNNITYYSTSSDSKNIQHNSFHAAFEPLHLSIDIDMQYIVSEELEEVIKEFNAVKGCCIVVDPNTGEVLAVVNKPDFDPHKIQNQDTLFPTSWYGLYEVGSVFKSLIIASALDSKTANLNSSYNIKKFSIGKYTFKDYHYYEKRQTVAEIFVNSSNIGTSLIANDINQEILRKYLKDFGLFDTLKIELPEKATPQYPKIKKWTPITINTISYGYGISITPMHFIQSMVPIVNGGEFFDLTILKNKYKDENYKVEQILQPKTSKIMDQLLRDVVLHSKVKEKINVPGLLIGGKTGTAHKLKNKKYDDKTRISSFVGIFPYNKPKYLIYLLLDEPKGNKSTFGFATAAYTAAPAVAKILSRIALLKGEKPQN